MRLASKTVTDALWVSMISMFGHKWVSQNGTVPNGTNSDAWAAALYRLSPEQIAAGMNEVAQSGMKWPPSAPEFRAMCFSLPSLGRVKLESKPNAERSPFTIMVWQRLDGHRYRAETDPDKADRMMAEAYAVAREDVLKGVPLPEKPVAVIGFEKRRRPVPASRSVVGAELAKMAEIFGGVPA